MSRLISAANPPKSRRSNTLNVAAISGCRSANSVSWKSKQVLQSPVLYVSSRVKNIAPHPAQRICSISTGRGAASGCNAGGVSSASSVAASGCGAVAVRYACASANTALACARCAVGVSSASPALASMAAVSSNVVAILSCSTCNTISASSPAPPLLSEGSVLIISP